MVRFTLVISYSKIYGVSLKFGQSQDYVLPIVFVLSSQKKKKKIVFVFGED